MTTILELRADIDFECAVCESKESQRVKEEKFVKGIVKEVRVTKGCGVWGLRNKKTGEIIRFLCGRCGCGREECRKRFWQRRVRLISALIEEYKLDKFFTLTLDRSESKECAWDGISGIWHKFLTVVKRKYPCFKFVAVLEAHRDGYPHVHGFTNEYIDKNEYKKHWHGCGGGIVTWVEKVKVETGEMASYVSKQLGKYVGKQNILQARANMGKGKRTIWRSEGMKAKFELKEGEWEIIKENIFEDDVK